MLYLKKIETIATSDRHILVAI